MANYHSNGKLPIAIRHEGKILYFESQKEAALFCGCSRSTINQRINKFSFTPINEEYYIDLEETNKLQVVAGYGKGTQKQNVETIPAKGDSGFVWNVKVNELEDPKLFIAKYSGRLSVKKMSELLGISTKEVRQLFEECWNDPAYEKYVRG